MTNAQHEAFLAAGWSSVRSLDSSRYRYTDDENSVDIEIYVCETFASLAHAKGPLWITSEVIRQALRLLGQG